ncbi:ectonucleoside triphosphate diphosphohydrolase 8 isoform X3 [Leptonychotes weddellii]|uniref:Ectonucleoside triphosphate diphosphohydrolase 8 n=1 Tax=Leptonychotes weddellii TaxID=9713 RepID=A0A7F8R545_LEPWE|nr:ectonucleoside triphosphate diphosphohydrolase 8 isoform X3 [Leptonychotes weddellii]
MGLTWKKRVLTALLGAAAASGLTMLILLLVEATSVLLPADTKFGIVFDAGSSHTSLFVYRWPADKENNTGVVSQALACQVKGPGISSYASNPAQAGESLQGCLEEALALVPEARHQETPMFLGATAGMRLLSQKNSSQAGDIFAAVSRVLGQAPLDFWGAELLAGQAEGALGWITINYVLGMLIKYSFSGEWIRPPEGTLVGALDMGGASTQITFVPGGPILDKNTQATFHLYGSEHRVYTHSYLCFGRDQMLTRLLARLVEVGLPPEEAQVKWDGLGPSAGLKATSLSSCRAAPGPWSATHVTTVATGPRCPRPPCMSHPVSTPHPLQTWPGTSRWKEQGTLGPASPPSGASSTSPAARAEDTVPSMGSTSPPCGAGSMHAHLTSPTQAFSNFYYTFHFLNLTSKQPLTTVNATVWEFCRRPWKQVEASSPGQDRWLRDHCASGLYILTLLLEGYGFREETWPDIEFHKQAGGTDIGWTLGYMLNLTGVIPAEVPARWRAESYGIWAAGVVFAVLTLLATLGAVAVHLLWPQG